MSMASSSVNRSGTAFNARSPKPAVYTTNAILAVDASPNLNQFTHPDTFKQEETAAQESTSTEAEDTIDLRASELPDSWGSQEDSLILDTFRHHIRLNLGYPEDGADLTLLHIASNWATRDKKV